MVKFSISITQTKFTLTWKSQRFEKCANHGSFNFPVFSRDSRDSSSDWPAIDRDRVRTNFIQLNFIFIENKTLDIGDRAALVSLFIVMGNIFLRKDSGVVLKNEMKFNIFYEIIIFSTLSKCVIYKSGKYNLSSLYSLYYFVYKMYKNTRYPETLLPIENSGHQAQVMYSASKIKS